RSFEADPASAGPAQNIALHIGDGNDRVVERGQNVRDAGRDILCAFGLDDLFAGGIVSEQLGGRGCSHRSGSSGRSRRRIGGLGWLSRLTGSLPGSLDRLTFGDAFGIIRL